MKDIIIYGSGGLGRETAWFIERINEVKPTFRILGFIDDNVQNKDKIFNGYRVLGNSSFLNEIGIKCSIVCAIANAKIRKK